MGSEDTGSIGLCSLKKRKAALIWSMLPYSISRDTPQRHVGPDENGAIRHGQRGIHRFASNRVGRQTLELWSGAEHENVRVFVRHIQPVSGENG